MTLSRSCHGLPVNQTLLALNAAAEGLDVANKKQTAPSTGQYFVGVFQSFAENVRKDTAVPKKSASRKVNENLINRAGKVQKTSNNHIIPGMI